MKTYIQPSSIAMNLQMESVIAASNFNINNQGTDAEVLSNSKTGWNCDDWSGANNDED